MGSIFYYIFQQLPENNRKYNSKKDAQPSKNKGLFLVKTLGSLPKSLSDVDRNDNFRPNSKKQ